VVERHLTISQHLLRSILEHCLEERPNEACGILTGFEGRVLNAYATDSARRSPVYYEVDPEQQEQVLSQMTERGEQLVGIYHSHPTAAAEPSHNDIRLAIHWPEAFRVIISLAAPTKVRAFLIKSGSAQEVVIDTPADPIGQWNDLRHPPK
jgi:proteasome lid subunit RPN8/RPN11